MHQHNVKRGLAMHLQRMGNGLAYPLGSVAKGAASKYREEDLNSAPSLSLRQTGTDGQGRLVRSA